MQLRIDDRFIGDNHSVFIIAELSCNHLQNFDLAIKTIKSMKKAGADAVKFQTFTPQTITMDCNSSHFRIKQGTLWDGKTLHQLYKETYMPWEWQPRLKKIADDLGLMCFSTPVDKTAVDFLYKMNVPAYKVSSFEITDIPLIEYIASKKKPVIISLGIATRKDIKEAVDACKRMGNNHIALLKCTSLYPTPLEEINLRMIPQLKKDFGCLIGISDHTLSISVPVASVALGARILEKHFIFDRKLGGPDSAFSLEPQEFKEMVEAIRETEKALGKIDYSLTKKIKRSREFARSLFVSKDINEGGILTEENIKSVRPGYGLHPKYFRNVIGKRALKRIKKGTPLSWKMIC